MTDETRMTALNASVGADDGRSFRVTENSISAFAFNCKDNIVQRSFGGDAREPFSKGNNRASKKSYGFLGRGGATK